MSYLACLQFLALLYILVILPKVSNAGFGKSFDDNVISELETDKCGHDSTTSQNPYPCTEEECVCPSKTIGNQVDDITKELQNCTVIEGHLKIVFMFHRVSADNYTGVSLPKLREITGFLLLYRVYSLSSIGKLFPNLSVIRGWSDVLGYSLILFEMDQLESISLPSLTYMGKGIVAAKNPQLCFGMTIEWRNIIAERPASIKFYDNRDSTACAILEGCPDSCSGPDGRCWDIDTCQRDCSHCQVKENENTYFIGCTPGGECCHQQCLGGCSSPNNASSCNSCRHIYYNGTCYDRCPPFNSNNETLYEYEVQGYATRRCVTSCECMDMHKYNKFHQGKCIYKCPTGWLDHPDITKDENRYNHEAHTCQECKGTCDKVCYGGTIQTISKTRDFRGCTIIDDMLEIAINTNHGNMSELRENLGQIHTVRKYVKIVRSHFLTHLDFFENLRVIEGTDKEERYGFYVMSNENLETIWDLDRHPKLVLKTGMMLFQQNPRLCYRNIRKLLEQTQFEGNTTEGGKTIRISSKTHTIYDVSDQNNGQSGNCYNNTLYLNISMIQSLNWVQVKFAAFNTSDTRIIISYLVYYRLVGKNETVSYYTPQNLCAQNSTEEESKWMVMELDPNQDNVDNYYITYLYSDLEPYSRYACYVQTYTTKAVGLDGARSEIKYFVTSPSEPEPPVVLSVTQIKPSEGFNNLGLEVMWAHPERPNGVIVEYRIFYKPNPWLTHYTRKDFCLHKMKEIEPAPTTEKPDLPELLSNGTCSCATNNTIITDNNTGVKIIRGGKTISEEEALFRYNLENTIQNNLLTKRTRRRRSVDDTFKYETNSSSTVSTVAVDLSSLYTTTATTFTTTTPTGVLPDEPGPSMVVVDRNTTSVNLLDLEPFTEYTIEVVACHAHDKLINRTRCSKRATSVGITSPDPSLDVINSSSLSVDTVKENDEIVALRFHWDPPKKTNGPVLTYIIHYAKVEESQSSVEATQEVCVPPKDFAENNNTYVWRFGSFLTKGYPYKFKVRVNTAADVASNNWSEAAELQLGQLPDANSDQAEIIGATLATVFVLAALLLLIGYFIYRRKKPQVPNRPQHDSINPDYVDTDNVYIPDEWELERTKVRIGEALGQGSFGMVYEGTAYDLLNTDKKPVQVAIKTVNNTASIQERINFLNEASTMKSFDCHHIVKLLGVVSQGSPVLVIMELMTQGDLRNYLRKHRPDEPDNDGRKPPTLKQILQMAAEIADGMAYLEHKKFVHRDLAARNCMVAKDMTVKIGDFGMSRDVYYSEYYRKGGKGMLPVRWMAPESLRDGVCTSKSDVWSFGIVLYEMATLAAQPYVGFTNEQVIPYVLEGSVMEMPSGCPRKLAELMTRCWQYYPKARPTFTQIIDLLQGDVKKSFFGVSWYYTQKDSDSRSQDSGHSLEDDQTINGAASEEHSLGDSNSSDVEYLGDLPGLYPNRNASSAVMSDSQSPKETDTLLNGHSYDSDDNEDANETDDNNMSDSQPKNVTESLFIGDYNIPPTYNSIVTMNR